MTIIARFGAAGNWLNDLGPAYDRVVSEGDDGVEVPLLVIGPGPKDPGTEDEGTEDAGTEDEAGGDPVCWAHLLCEECGAITAEGHRDWCSR